ncbi:16S rRNA (guanine(966)-N(2))-methyltransferase RsmD [Virgibacillus sp. 179-BFC.A HS]|uniref:16S rRNA (Guanine(966)-N(2))-methyltransferase RsmD n=1 Tax=Tigheibacillus jepli TaxID=3035914 RepID=A0ABU5CI30_9BACI|nr:16S rRNA (guanine(966)-N(2))-methyltransferase RsmD [Virgibacillus sp. 179-BFC.A HS]MDY0405984.1 16S rRNA (guanine(966)-N(2))-methyltransferase RsmD [Virgibacillus sp. 179-BFC.A HS]
MRIIAGEHKGRNLKAVPGKATRPTTDKVKEAVFQMMGPFFNGGNCLDLFAGSGSLGIEAISRGMKHAIFVDNQNKAIQTIRENINQLKIAERTEIYRTEAKNALRALEKRQLKFSLILLDPPYKKYAYEDIIRTILRMGLLEENGFIYCEHDAAYQMPPIEPDLTIVKEAGYGTIGVTIYQKGTVI